MSTDDVPPVAVPAPLTMAVATQALSDVGYTADGSGVAFLKLDVASKALTDLAGVELPHVRYVVADGNPLKVLRGAAFAGFKSLVTASLAGCGINQLDDFAETAPHLANLDLSRNELVNLRSTAPPKKPAPPPTDAAADGDGGDADSGVAADDDAAAAAAAAAAAGPAGTEFTFSAPGLRVLLLNHNKLITLEGFNGPSFSRLVRLELASNGLLTLAMDEPCPALRELILSHNALTSLAGIDKFPRLRLLDLDGNGITSLAPLLEVVKGWPAADGGDAADGKPGAGPTEAEEDADADSRPLCALRVLSLRTTALPDSAWGELDGLAALPRLRVSATVARCAR